MLDAWNLREHKTVHSGQYRCLTAVTDASDHMRGSTLMTVIRESPRRWE
jgi:hypothetical protein